MQSGVGDINEFMYFDGSTLVGYIGICGFGGASKPLEITGMVHPEYRRRGVFAKLHTLVTAECRRRNTKEALGLCDQSSASGQGFLQSIGARYQCAELEMVLRDALFAMNKERLSGVALQKAANAVAVEVARHNSIFIHNEAVNDGGRGFPAAPARQRARRAGDSGDRHLLPARLRLC